MHCLKLRLLRVLPLAGIYGITLHMCTSDFPLLNDSHRVYKHSETVIVRFYVCVFLPRTWQPNMTVQKRSLVRSLLIEDIPKTDEYTGWYPYFGKVCSNLRTVIWNRYHSRQLSIDRFLSNNNLAIVIFCQISDIYQAVHRSLINYPTIFTEIYTDVYRTLFIG